MYKLDIFEHHRFNEHINKTKLGRHHDKLKKLNNHPDIYKKNDNLLIINGSAAPRVGSILYK
jgi:hypothetical protein